MAKKSFKDVSTAADTFIPPNMDTADNTAETHNTHNTQYNGTKSKRAQFLVYPDLLEDIKKIAYMQRKSVNGLVNELFTEYRANNGAELEKYETTFKGGK